MYKVSIKAVLPAPDGRIVLLLNEREEWELPGGQIELGETPPECLAREIAEELGLQVAVEAAPLDSYLFEVIPGRHVFIVTYRAQLTGPFLPRLSHEHRRWALFAPQALPSNLPSGYRASILSAAQIYPAPQPPPDC